MSSANNKLSRKAKIILSVIAVIAVIVFTYFFGGKNISELTGGDESNGSYISDVLSEIKPSVSEKSDVSSENNSSSLESKPEKALDKNGIYTSKDDVALYIRIYNKLPSNFIKKADAEKLGWSGGALDKYAKNKCIGGDYFGNYEGVLPKKSGRKYTECDIDTLGASKRGEKRIVFSNDGLIYYTEDHYETFELLYGKE